VACRRRGLNNLLLVDAGLYGFLAIRRLSGTGFDFHLHWSDWKTGLRELVFFAPAVIALGLALGFLHPHANVPAVGKAVLTWAGIFVFVAVPEELFFRAWVQNLLERRVGRRAALVIASVLFGLSHFQQTVRTLQLALRSAGHDRGDFLRSSLAREPARSSLDDHAHLRGLVVGVVVLRAPVREAQNCTYTYILIYAYTVRRLPSAPNTLSAHSLQHSFRGRKRPLLRRSLPRPGRTPSKGNWRVLESSRTLLRLFNHLHQDSTTYER
jgi:hypothetical protein